MFKNQVVLKFEAKQMVIVSYAQSIAGLEGRDADRLLGG
jgi:hypothetical protein